MGVAAAAGAAATAMGAVGTGAALTAAAGTLGGATMTMGLLGTGTSVIGGIQQSQAQAAQMAYQSKVAANNAQIASNNASLAAQEGTAATTAQEMKNRRTMGAIVATQGASGVDVNTGSNLNVQESQDILGQNDAATTRYNYALKSYGYENQAASYTAQSQLDTNASQSYADQELTGALGTTFNGMGGMGRTAMQILGSAPSAAGGSSGGFGSLLSGYTRQSFPNIGMF